MQSRLTRQRRTAFAMLLPSLIGVGLFLIVPIFILIGLSFFSWDLISAPHFAGVANYRTIFSDPGFWASLLTTLTFSIIAIPAALILGLFIALGLNRRLPGTRFLQLLYVTPWVAAPLALGVIWSWILAPSGLLNTVLGTSTAWLADEKTALPALALVYVWQNVGYISLFFLAGLQGVPRELLEAAALDGAGRLRRLWSVTLPLIRPTTFFVTVTSFIASFQVFDLVYGLTNGNPGYPGGTTEVIAARIYSTAFVSPQIGVAAAMAVVLSLIIVGITLAQQRYYAKRVVYEVQ